MLRVLTFGHKQELSLEAFLDKFLILEMMEVQRILLFIFI